MRNKFKGVMISTVLTISTVFVGCTQSESVFELENEGIRVVENKISENEGYMPWNYNENEKKIDFSKLGDDSHTIYSYSMAGEIKENTRINELRKKSKYVSHITLKNDSVIYINEENEIVHNFQDKDIVLDKINLNLDESLTDIFFLEGSDNLVFVRIKSEEKTVTETGENSELKTKYLAILDIKNKEVFKFDSNLMKNLEEVYLYSNFVVSNDKVFLALESGEIKEVILSENGISLKDIGKFKELEEILWYDGYRVSVDGNGNIIAYNSNHVGGENIFFSYNPEDNKYKTILKNDSEYGLIKSNIVGTNIVMLEEVDSKCYIGEIIKNEINIIATVDLEIKEQPEFIGFSKKDNEILMFTTSGNEKKPAGKIMTFKINSFAK